MSLGLLASMVLGSLLAIAIERAQGATQRAPYPQMDRFIDSLVARMTVEEKLGQLTQVHERGEEEFRVEIRAGRVGSLLGSHGAVHLRELQRVAVEESRLKIPLLFALDVLYGFRTIFPVPLAQAGSWDPAAVEQAARIVAIEATAAGVHWTYAPMVDIARDPRWGRIVDGAGEDPYLGSVMAAARVRGFQGTDLAAPNSLLACAKHYVAYGGAEGGRDYNVVDISERTLRETYLPPFRAAVDAGVATVMAAFNEVAGTPMHANRRLLREVLRGEWGFDGLVVSDHSGIKELVAHGVAGTPAEAGLLALRAGMDVDMVSHIYVDVLPRLVRAEKLLQAAVDDAVRRVLRAKYRLGLFEDPYRDGDPARERDSMFTPAHLAAAREMARKSTVLLKNERKVLPLSTSIGTLAVIGALADDAQAPLGRWGGVGQPEDVVTILAGIRHAVSPQTKVLHAQGADLQGTDTSGFAEAVRLASEADVVVLVLGEHHDMSGEATSRSTLDLPGVQLELAKAVHATGKPVVVVLMNGRPLAITWLAEHVPAILEAWFLGVQMGPAVADVLFGNVSPSGKLPVSFPRAVGQVPIYYNHKNTGRPPSPTNPYTSKYLDLPWTPLYPFGHGLSYTTFAYRNLRLSASTMRPSDTLTVRVDVTNAGARAGDEVVQLYLRDEVASVTRPVKELRDFQRISLRPGETRTLAFTLDGDDLAFYDREMRRVVEPGFFTVYVGASSQDVQEARFEVMGGS